VPVSFIFAGLKGTDPNIRWFPVNEILPLDRPLLLFGQDAIVQLVSAAPSAVLMVDHEMRVIAVSDRWRSEFNITDKNLSRRSYYELFPAFPKECKEVHLRCLAGEKLKCDREHLQDKDGRHHWFRWEIAPWLHADKSVGGLLLFIESFTELENKVAELNAALSAGEIGIWSRDLITKRIDWSPETEKIWGFEPGEFDGTVETFESRIHPDDLNRLNESIESNEFYQTEFRIFLKDGSIRWIRGQGKYEYDPDGKPIRLFGASVDVTPLQMARKESLEERDRLNDLLEITRESEKIAQTCTWSHLLSTGKVTWSEGAHLLLGLDSSTPLPDFEELKEHWFYPDDLPIIEQVLQDAANGADEWTIKHRILRNDGHIRWIRAFGKVYRNPAGIAEQFVGVLQDITETEELLIENQSLLQVLEQKVEERTAQLKVAIETKTRFLANMSHEIRNPLNSVTILSNLLGQEGLKEEDRKNFVHRINTAIRSVTEILDDILEFSKMEAGQIVLSEHPFKVNNLLSDLKSLYMETADLKGLVLEIADGQPDIEVVGDEKRLRQILINLVGNALKFTEKGSITVTHHVWELGTNTVILGFEVIDTGIGIEAKSLHAIFDPFTQADNGVTRKYGGTGLGLSITKSLIQMMEGQIQVTSTPGLGSKFSFFVRLNIKGDGAGCQNPEIVPMNRALACCNILVVDDDTSNLEVMKALLSGLGARVHTAMSGKAAIDFLSEPQNSCSVVLMDVQMPDMDGITATKRIRSDLHRDQLPIIAITGGILPEQQKEALEAGMTALLRKPVDTDALIRRLLSFCSEDCKKIQLDVGHRCIESER
jgi:two-component system, sensor histidine kinase and response regulator